MYVGLNQSTYGHNDHGTSLLVRSSKITGSVGICESWKVCKVFTDTRDMVQYVLCYSDFSGLSLGVAASSGLSSEGAVGNIRKENQPDHRRQSPEFQIKDSRKCSAAMMATGH